MFKKLSGPETEKASLAVGTNSHLRRVGMETGFPRQRNKSSRTESPAEKEGTSLREAEEAASLVVGTDGGKCAVKTGSCVKWSEWRGRRSEKLGQNTAVASSLSSDEAVTNKTTSAENIYKQPSF